jgi:bacitracin transport system permease protein
VRDLFNVLLTELMKLKNTKIHWLVLLGAIPANLVTLTAFLPRVTPEGTQVGLDLQDMFYRQGMVITILAPFMFALMTGYIISREYQERTINQLFSYPISRIKILMAKLAAVLLLIVVTSALSCVTVTASGVVMLLSQTISFEVVWLGIRMNMLACLLSFGTVPVAAALSMVGKSVIPSTVLGVFATVVTLIGEMGHGMRGILFPWLMPYWPVRELGQGLAEIGPNPYAVPGSVILAVTFLVSLVFCLVYYEKAEIHSGS